MHTDTRKRVFWITLILLIVTGIYLFVFRNYLSLGFMHLNYAIESANEVSVTDLGEKYIIDNGKTRIIKLNEADKIIKNYEGGSEKATFYYAAHVCEDNAGCIYIADLVYGDNGSKIEKEHIYKLDGFKKTCLVSYDYEGASNQPLQYGNILELRYDNGLIYYVYKTLAGDIAVNSILADGTVDELRSYHVPEESGISDASYDILNDYLIMSDRRGNIYCQNVAQNELTMVNYQLNEALIPDVLAVSGKGYFTDMTSQSIYEIDNKASAISKIYGDDNIYAQFTMNALGKIYATDRETVFKLPLSDSESLENIKDVKFKHPVILIVSWISAVIFAFSGIVLIIFFISFINSLIKKNDENGFGLRMLEVTVACILVSVFVTYSMVQTVTTDKKTTMMEDLEMFTSVISSFVDAADVEMINSISDYNSPEYIKLKTSLDAAIEESYSVEKFYYYDIVIPNFEQQTFDLIMDYENAYLCTTPVYSMGDNEYSMSFDNQEMVSVEGGMSSYGSWSYCLYPIVNNEGVTVGLLEVGMNFNHVRNVIKQFTIDSIIDVFCASTVIAMLVLEILFLASFYESKKRKDIQYEGIEIPIRMLVFLVFMADSMQDGFVAILCARLYEESVAGWIQMLPKGLAVALPMSAQLFVAAVATILGGRYVDKKGTKRIILTGFIASILGFGLCGIGLGYTMILLGKCIIGLGQGFVYVAANAAAGMGTTEKSSAKGFADVSAGVLSGITIGVGLGTVALTVGDYHLVYIIGALSMLPGLLISIRSKDIQIDKEDEAESASEIGLKDFMLSREVWTFFFLLLTPFMIAISFRDYVFPLFVEQFGVSEVRIGQFYLLCGMLVLYIGPSLANAVIDHFGGKGCSIFASIMLAIAMGVFAIYPTKLTAFLGVEFLYLTICFAYTCQYFSFENMQTVKRYEIGKAMGIYSMFENLGQTLGPIVFGALAIMGISQSVVVFLGLYVGALLVFVLMNIRKKNGHDRVSAIK